MIKAIFFDWGGVFTHNPRLDVFSKEYTKRKGIDYEAFNSKMIELWDSARVGKMDSNIFWYELGGMAGVSPEQFYDDLETFSGHRPEVLQFVQDELYGKYKLGIISNQIETWFEPQIKQYKLNNIFDVIATSYKCQSAKPDFKIFNDALKQLKVNADECVYIDDMEKNIPPAQQLGMKAILYKDLQQLKGELKKYL